MTKRPLKKIIYRLTSVLHNNKNLDRTTCILMWHTSDLVNWHSTKTTVNWVELASCPAVRPYSGLASTLPSYWLLCHTTERKIQSPFATPAAAGHHRRSSNVCTWHHPHIWINTPTPTISWTASPVAEGLHATYFVPKNKHRQLHCTVYIPIDMHIMLTAIEQNRPKT